MVKREGFPIITMLLLVLFSFFFMAVPSYAYSENTTEAVTLSTWVEGESLYILATSSTGIDAVFIDDTRINYRVDDVLVLSLKEHTNKETLKIYAMDFNGNRSSTQTVQNPFYQVPKTSSVHSSTKTPNTPTVSSVPMVASSPTSAPTESPSIEASPSTPSAETKPFTPAGNGETVDNATSEDGKEFFTITTPDGNIFYLVIDRQRGDHDVYFLNAVTENDLLALAEKSETASETSPPAPSTPVPTETTTSAPEKEEIPEKKNGGNNPLIIVLLLIAAGGAVYYCKVLKPKATISESFDDEDDDDFDEEDDEQDEYNFDEEIDPIIEEKSFEEEPEEFTEEIE